MWIDFEGIDGSGKTTVSTRVAEALRRRGIPVVHAREGGTFASPIAGRVRDLARSMDCLFLAPQTELLLNLAREAQLVAEVVRPALDRGAWVITDRTIYSHLGLARSVRGLAGGELDAAARMAVQGILPDRVFVVDVDPDVARWRRRIRKVRDRRLDDPGRKGLAGDALADRTRRAFLERAAGEGWTVLDNTWRTLEETVGAVLDALEGRGVDGALRSTFEADPENLEDAWFDFAEGVADRSLAAMLVAGLDDPRADRIRRRAPADVAAYAVSGMDGPTAWSLRRDLRGEAPFYVARGLWGLGGLERAWALRRELEATVPDQVVHSLAGVAGDEAHAVRLRRWAEHPQESVRSTMGIDDDRSWSLRARAREESPSAALAESVQGLDSPAAREIRDEFREDHPLAVLRSVKGMATEEAWGLRAELAGVAPKAVLASMEGLDGPEARARRKALKAAAPEETAASLVGLDSPQAWDLRRELRDAAPVGVIKSLRGTDPARAEALASEILAAHPRRLRVAREAVQLRMNAIWTRSSI
jgi:dTMP kinase